jgi:hypothetical protein
MTENRFAAQSVRIAELVAENTQLKAQLAAVKRPVSDEEMRPISFQRYGTDGWVVSAPMLTKWLAARTQPTAQDTEEKKQ